jgi:predicted esterase
MAVGKEDPLIPYERAKASAQTLKIAGANLTYRDYDTGHRLNAPAMHDLKAWWRAQRESIGKN